MKLCPSVCMAVFKHCAAPATTQVELGRSLLLSLTEEDFVYYDDAQISDLMHGRKNLGDNVVAKARACAGSEYVCRFDRHVASLLDPNKIAVAVAAFRRVVMEDSGIRADTKVDVACGHTKRQIAERLSFPPGLLASVFLYAVRNVENKGTRSDSGQVTDEFMASCAADASVLLLTEEWDESVDTCVTLWRRGPNAISLRVGDLFAAPLGLQGSHGRKIVVIPVDTTFGVELAKGLEGGDPFRVSPSTLHGKWLQRQRAAGETSQSLKKRIERELSKRGCAETGDGRYRIGSIAALEQNDTTYCLLAIAEHDGYGNTHSDAEQVVAAVEALALFYDREGQGYPMHIPLIGTGRSRTGLTYGQACRLIVDTLKKRSARIQGSVFLVVTPDAYDDLKGDLDGLQN